METQNLKNSTINDLVSDNYVYASVLYYLGIRFFEYSEETLKEVCLEKGMNVERVVEELTRPNGEHLDEYKISKFPIDLLIEFLKHSHYNFAKKKLPYLANLIDALDGTDPEYGAIEKDLQIIFPMFVEDFIHHIYMEEDTFFRYALQLHKMASGKGNIGKIFYQMNKYSVSEFASEHDVHDDEMEGIRKITNDYFIDKNTPLHIKVVYQELSDFETELVRHASIENNILFPKALGLENEAREIITSTSKLN